VGAAKTNLKTAVDTGFNEALSEFAKSHGHNAQGADYQRILQAFRGQFIQKSRDLDMSLSTLDASADAPGNARAARSASAAARRGAAEQRHQEALTDQSQSNVIDILKQINAPQAALEQYNKDLEELSKAEQRGVITAQQKADAEALLKTRLEDQGDPFKKTIKDLKDQAGSYSELTTKQQINQKVLQITNDLLAKGRPLHDAHEKALLQEAVAADVNAANHDRLRNAYEQVLSKIEPANAAQVEYAKDMKALNNALEGGAISLGEYTKAWKELGAYFTGDLRQAMKMVDSELSQEFGPMGFASTFSSAYKKGIEDILKPTQDFQATMEALTEVMSKFPDHAGAIQKSMDDATVSFLQWKDSIGEGDFMTGFTEKMLAFADQARGITAQLGGAFATTLINVGDGIAESIGAAIFQAKSLGQAITQVARSAMQELITSLIKLGLRWLVNHTLGSVLRKAAAAESLATMKVIGVASAAQAAATAAAWAPAATAVSIASFGAADAAAAAAMTTTYALGEALAMTASAIGGAATVLAADGGFISGPGGPREDKILARLSNGEFVVNAAATAKNRDLLEMINSGRSSKRHAEGGFVGTRPAPPSPAQRSAPQGGSANYEIHMPINVQVKGDVKDPKGTAEELAGQLKPLLEPMVLGVIQKHQRPGGQLSNPKRTIG
jgi:hypothetical protein